MKSSTFNGYPVHLIETVDELLSLKRVFSPKIMAGLDTETSSLEYKADQIAGVCVSGGVDYSPQGYAGYYIPMRHIGYSANLPVDVVMEFVQWLIDNFQTVLFNRNFDTSMLEYDGVKIPFVGGMHDAQIMAYSVFNEAYPSLKDYSRRFLKWDMIDFAENKAKDHNFKTTDPTVSYIYAAGDPIATVFLARKLWATYPYIRKIYKIDNYCLEAVRRLCQNELTLDYDFLENLRDETERHLAEIRTKIYSMSGVYGFNIDSSREKADVLSRFVTLTEKTKSGKFKTDEEALRRLNHPIANLMVDYSQTRVFLKSFVAKMCTYKGRIVRANYNTVNVPSGRLSSGASEGNPYFVPQNMQNCLVGDTRVQTKDGMKLLRDVKVGDYVWDGDEFRRITQKVNQGVRKVYRMTLADGKTLVGTADHPILSENGFVELAKCKDLRVALNSKKIYPRARYGFIRFRVGRGPYPSTKEVRYLNYTSPDYLRSKFWVKCLSVEEAGEEEVFDITVETSERFMANGIIVHNCPKEEEKLYLHHHPKIGYVLLREEEGCVRDAKGEPVKYKTKTGLHRAFIPHDKDWVIMSSDYCLNPESTVVTEKGVMTLRDMLEQPKGLKVLTPWGYKETYDLRYTGKHKQYKFELTTGETLICSPEHRLAVGSDGMVVWVEAKSIRTTDYLLTAHGTWVVYREAPLSNIKEIAVSEEPIEMMDMGVRDVHCFYCNGILVHNCAQELRLAANFSRDPNFLEPLLKGDDIHMHVAKQMFGYEDPLHRTKVKIVNFCLGEDSYVMTDSGIVRPASLRGDERLLKVFGGTQSYRMEVRLSDTVKVHYSNGVVEEYDSRHQVAVTSDKGLTWKRVCDLTEDDEVLISVGRMKETSSPLIERVGTYRKFSVSREKEYNLSTKEFAYLAGLYLGDGHISLGKQGRPNSVSWVAEEQIYPLVEECLTKLGLKWGIQNYEGKNYRLYRVHSSQFARVLCKHFGRTKTKTISDEVFSTWGKDLFIPLCQGLVDSDGTLHGNVLVYLTCLDELAKKVALVLSGLGIYVRERVVDHNCHHLRMSENDVVQSNLDRKRWGPGRPLLDFRKYDRSILEGLPGGFENGRVDNMRRDKCGLWVKSSLVEKAGYSGLRPVSVVSVSKPKTGKIYVIETETGSYISSSVVSHNSALYGAEYPTISARLGIPKEEGKTLMNKYKQTMSKLYAWKAEIVKAAKKRGYALTYFGRPVYLLKYFNSPDRGMSAYAERLATNATIQGPVTPDTPVLLEDGYHLMKDVPDQGVCATGKGFARYVKVFSGVQPIVELEFEDGSILKCSKEHRLLSVQPSGLQWMKASEIVEGTPIASHTSSVEGSPILFDLSDQGVRAFRVSSEINNRVEETIYWIGRAFGDGSFLENGVIHWVFGIHECEDRDRLVKWGNAIGLHVNLQEFSKEKDKSRRGDCLRATISSKNLCRLFKQIGVQFGVTSHDKRIPSRVFTASFEQKRQFVRGLFDSDGSKNWGWGWHMCNGDLLHDLQTLLLSMGVFNRWHKCKDAYILTITSLKEFALLMGRERLISKCQQSRMLVPDYMASRFVEKFRSGELRYFRKDILSTDKTIIYKLRKRRPVGCLKFVELCDRFGWDVWKEDDFYFYKKVKSIRALGESEVYCLSVEDHSHQFITNGVVSHNCILADTYTPSQDGKTISTMRNFAGKRVQFAKDERGTAHKGVPVFRGKLPCAMVEFLSGDFIMVSTNHKFLKYKSNTLLSIEEATADAVQFVKPHKKVKLFKAILNTLLGRFKGTTLNSLAVFPRHDIPADSVEIATILFRAFIRDEHLTTHNPVLAHSVRSLVDLYGYNLVKVCSGRYALSWSRAKKSKVCFVENLKGTYDVMSPTMISGFQTYPLSGMIHKNTGADLMRLFLIKFTKLNIDDKDWRENTRMILPVHDEMNLEVSIPYMREAWLKMRKVMNFSPDNFAVPIIVDTGVGTSWGNCLDVECISPKGRVVPKDIDPNDFSGEERAYLQEILEECVFEELPDRLKKFVKC